MPEKIIAGITQGDPNGIGLEVIIKTFQDPQMLEICTPVLFSSQKTFSYHRKMLGAEIRFNPVRNPGSVNPKQFNLLNVYEEEINIELGKATDTGGKYALKSLEAATIALEQKKIDVLITAPVNKHTIHSENFPFKGHTEYFETRFKTPALMLMCSDDFRVGTVTGHVPIAEIVSSISEGKIREKIKILHKTLQTDFQKRKPKIAVLGLNPHAGDEGTIGKEEQEMIIPSIRKLQNENILVMGPYSADGFFGSMLHLQFDAVLVMYHDQGLIPFKAMVFSSGVNYTAGLPFIRTSPAHGVGYDIAGQNKASEESFRSAVYLACDVFRNRNFHGEITTHPLKTVSQKERE